MILGALAFSVVLNFLLASRAGAQRLALAELRRQYKPLLRQTVQGFEASRLDGRRVSVDYGDANTPTVLYVFTVDCSWCARNYPSFIELAERVGSRFRFVPIALSRDGLEAYVASHPFPAPVVTGLDDATVKRYLLGGTPQTIVVDPSGTVMENWHGTYTGDERDDIETFFGVSLSDTSPQEETVE